MADQRGVDYKGYTQLRYIGVTWVLFVGIIFGHFGLTIDTNLLHFLKEFGLVLFVYSIGLQVGPGFFSSFRSGGLRLNFLASLRLTSSHFKLLQFSLYLQYGTKWCGFASIY